MKTRFVVTAAILASWMFPIGAGLAQEKQEKKQPPTEQTKPKAGSDEEAFEFDGPGPPHKALAKLAGEYTTATKFTMSGAPAEETKGTATLKMILGGRFLSEENATTFMGEPTQGMHLLGYNNAGSRYEAAWLYTGSTAILNLTGTSKDDGKTISLEGSFDDGAGGKTTLRIVLRTVDADHFVETLKSVESDGNEGPTLETTYTRKK
ncbi:MAG: DUF1579 domain-containing protein [Planctomycetes bacterium]|nr:DUF1579 domain-containing protein [Planctomycetota bacterium]MBI3846249.1 DUF1579 domain-containing protein [Planctomycetota bacterium]